MYQNQDQLLEQLVRGTIITQDVANDVKKRALDEKQRPEQILMAEGKISEDALLEVKAKLLNIPSIDLRGLQIPKQVLNLIPREVAENYQMVPFEQQGTELHVGMVNPQDFKAVEVVEFLAQKTDLKVRYYLISEDGLKITLRQYRKIGEETEEALLHIDKKTSVIAADEVSLQEMEQVIKSAPVSKIVLVILRHAVDGRASDVHIEPTLKDTKVRYRIDGILRTTLVLPKYIHAAIIARVKVLANLKLDETRKPQDGRIRLSIEGRDIDFRVSTLPLFEGEKVVLRILDSTSSVPALEKLGYHDVHINTINKNVKRPHGLILLTGPTGSGKTTTLYTVLSILNKDGTNIVTLEDPIEYYMSGVNQSQINPEIGYSFSTGLRAILRQDPNVIMVGEIRDKETTELVIHASLTGHIILSTLHTNDALGAIPRMIDLGAEPFLLSSVINLIIAQRLARKICPDCKTQTEIPARLMKQAKEQIDRTPTQYLEGINTTELIFYKGKGCARCGNLGYQGRTAVAELIDITPEIREIINRGGDQLEIEKVLPKQNFISLAQDSLIKALQGVTTIDEVLRIASF